jgi:hypothetical protein
VLVSTADVVWGHMWGVGSEHKVVGTGLVGVDMALGAGDDDMDGSSSAAADELGKGKGKGRASGKGKGKGKGKARESAYEENEWRSEAKRALGLVFEVS